VSLPPEPIWLYADAARLEQVLVNLLTNAAKYTDDGGQIWLTVEMEGVAPVATFARTWASPPETHVLANVATTPHVIIRVRDTGVGISPELLPHVFDLFTQAERSLDRSQGGLGIGLALVQRLTELHGGTVEAHSASGEGSQFIVRLPIESDESQVSGKEPAAGSSPEPSTPRHSTAPVASAIPLTTPGNTVSPLRVLVVDDNVDSAETLGMLLCATGHDVRTAHDGLAALEAALDYRPSVAVLDIGLPGLNGYELAKRIRQEPTLKHVVLVALTGYGQELDRETSLEAGFDHHLVKPARFAQLQQILASVVVSGRAFANVVIASKPTQKPAASAVPLIRPTTLEVVP
jgi:CheY-like chemotaxis protein